MTMMPNFEEKGGIDLLLTKFDLLSKGIETPFEEEEFLELINFYITNSELKRALRVYSFAHEFFPLSFDINLSEAQILIESGLYSAASKKLKELYKQEPEDLSLLMLIGLNYSQSGLINKAISFYDKAISLVPVQDQSFFMFSIAQTFINSGRYDIAIFYLSNARRKDPENDQIILDLAFCMERLEKYKNSEKLFTLYLQKNPFSEIAWYNLGVVLGHIGNVNKAIKAYDFALAIDPTFSSALFNKANLYYDQKDYKNSISVFSLVLTYESENSLALMMRGISYFKTSQLKKAEKDILASLKIKDNNAEAWFYLSKIYFDLSLKHSKKALYKALTFSSIKSEYWNFAAKIFNKEKKNRLADIAFIHAISFDPFVDKYWFEYSDFKKNINDFKDAISILKTGKDFISDTYNFNLRISSLYLLLEDKKNALSHFKNAYKINPNAIDNLIELHPNKEQASILVKSKK